MRKYQQSISKYITNDLKTPQSWPNSRCPCNPHTPSVSCQFLSLFLTFCNTRLGNLTRCSQSRGADDSSRPLARKVRTERQTRTRVSQFEPECPNFIGPAGYGFVQGKAIPPVYISGDVHEISTSLLLTLATSFVLIFVLINDELTSFVAL